ncbi:MAG TPA: TonB-dependent receptor [Longimicrobium sp.]|jgi:outer membrane receptor protein involved in Fe transport
MKIPILSLLALSVVVGTTASAQIAPPPVTGQTPPAVPQAAPGEVRGTVLDAVTGRPIPNASVAVMSAADSSLVTGALTRADGEFRAQGLAAGSYYLRISHPGHAAATRGSIRIASDASRADAGTVRLQQAAVALRGLSVTAQAGPVRTSADRNSYATRDMPGTAGGNAADVLRNVPSVEVDADGRPSLRGSQNVAVQVNGRAAPVRGEQLGQFLQQLPAGMVERVEVIPNPSARYDPEGLAGIVNIVLKANADLGLSGGLTTSAGSSGQRNATGNLGWQRGRVTLFGSYGYMDDERGNTAFSTRENLSDGAPVRRVVQIGTGSTAMRSNTLNTSAEVRLGAAETLGGTLLLSDRAYAIGSASSRSASDAAGTVLSRWNDRNTSESRDLVFDGTLSWRRLVRPRADETSLDLRYNWLQVDMENGLALMPAGAPDGAQQTRRVMDAVNAELAFQADATRMVAGARVEAGVRAVNRSVGNQVSAQLSTGAGESWQPDAGASFVLGTRETVRAAYGVVTRAVGAWELQGGVRVERTGREWDDGAAEPASYTDLFPSGLVAWNLGTSRQLKASYSRRIQRPQIQMLNSMTFYEDPLNRFRGNPRLKPEYTDAFELGFQQSGAWGTFQLAPFYRRTAGAIRLVRSMQGDTTTGTFTNLSSSRSYGADATASLRGGRLSGVLGFNAFQHETSGAVATGSIQGSGLGWSARASGNLRLGARTDLQAFAQYRAPMNIPQGRLGSMINSNLSLRQKLIGERGSLTLRVVDPFDLSRNRRTTDATLEELPFVMESERSFGARTVSLAFSYSFGQAPKLRAPRPQEAQAGGDGGN